jgi:CheY-like chemotaxis protein
VLIALTGYSQEKNLKRVAEGGSTAMTKPVDTRVLTELLAEIRRS